MIVTDRFVYWEIFYYSKIFILQWFSRIVVVPGTKQFQTVRFLKNYVVRTPVPNTGLWKIFNMFDRIKLIKRYIFFNKIKIFSMFDVCLRSNILKIFQSPVFGTVFEKWQFYRYGTVWYCLVLVTTTIRENHCSIIYPRIKKLIFC